jgi:hypothetical protein
MSASDIFEFKRLFIFNVLEDDNGVVICATGHCCVKKFLVDGEFIMLKFHTAVSNSNTVCGKVCVLTNRCMTTHEVIDQTGIPDGLFSH